jgi:hypothetical protein
MKYTIEQFEGITDFPFRVVDDTGEYVAMCFSEIDAEQIAWVLNKEKVLSDIAEVEEGIESLRIAARNFCENRSEERYQSAVWSLRDIYRTLRGMARRNDSE